MIKNPSISNHKVTFHIYRYFSNSAVKCEKSTISRLRFKEIKNSSSKGKSATLVDYALLVFPAATFGLGIWQTKRLYWKKSLIEELNRKKSAPPVELPDDLKDLEALEYQKVRVKGRFDHSREQYIGPRSFINDGVEGESHGLIGNPDGVGWHVITPFQVDGGEKDGEYILINRGWVQDRIQSPTKRHNAQIEGVVEINGVVRLTEQRQQFAPKHRTFGDKWQYRDIPSISTKLGTQPIFLDADVHSTIPGGPIGGQTRVSLRNDHFTYLLTWYTLSATTLFMWCKRFLVK